MVTIGEALQLIRRVRTHTERIVSTQDHAFPCLMATKVFLDQVAFDTDVPKGQLESLSPETILSQQASEALLFLKDLAQKTLGTTV